MTGIGAWLAGIGLERYEALFKRHAIDLEVLPDLTEADLQNLGIPLGHRKKLLKAIQAWRGRPQASPSIIGDAERRQLTIVFCDLVGYTPLAARMGPEDLRKVVLAYQRACASAVERFGGRVVQYLGDGILAYFGYPRAMEHDPERAVRAGLEVVAATRALEPVLKLRLQTRVGIATGEVVVVGESSQAPGADRGDAQSGCPPSGACCARHGGAYHHRAEAYPGIVRLRRPGLQAPEGLPRAGERVAGPWAASRGKSF